MPTEIIPTSPSAFGYLPGKNQVGGGLNGPGCLTYFGHSYFDPTSGVTGPNFGTQGGLINSDQSFFKQSLAALGLSESKCINYATSTSNIINDNGGTTSSKGGHVQVLQSLAPTNIRLNNPGFMAPWTANAGLVVLCWGINDVQAYAGGNQDGLYRKAYVEAWRTVISRCRAACVFEALSDTVITSFSGGGLGGTDWTTTASITTCSGAGYAKTSNVGATVTLSIPSDYDGGPIALGFIGRKGATGGQANITIDGVLTDTINTSNITADSTSAIGTAWTGQTLVLTRRYSLTPAKTHTITITTTGIDGEFDYNFCQFEAREGNPIIWCSMNRLRTYSGGYDHDNNVLIWNDLVRSMIKAEFAEPIEEANLDDAIQSSKAQSTYQNYRISYDTIHLSELGSRYGAAAVLDAYIRLNETTTLAQATTNQRDTIGTGFYIPQAPTVTNQYLYPASLTAAAAVSFSSGTFNNAPTAFTASAGKNIFVIPIVITRPCTLNNVVFDSITVATGTMRLGLYHDKGNVVALTGQTQGPFQLCYDWGSYTQTVGTARAFAIPSGQQKLIVPGVYWLALLVINGSTLTATTLNGGHSYVNSSSFGSPRPVNGCCYVQTYAANQTTLPASFSALTSTQSAIDKAPFMALSVASVP